MKSIIRKGKESKEMEGSSVDPNDIIIEDKAKSPSIPSNKDGKGLWAKFTTTLRKASFKRSPNTNNANQVSQVSSFSDIEEPKMTANQHLEKKLKELLNSYKVEEISEVLSKLTIGSDGGKQTPVKGSPRVEDKDYLRDVDDKFKAEALKIFNVADADKSGTIDEKELYDLLTQLMGPITLPESNRIYHDMDTNKSGTITFDEFLAGLLKYKWDISHVEDKKKKSAFEWEIPFQELKLGTKLGKGCYGTVYQAKWRGIDVACKKLRMSDEEDVLTQFKNEIAILGKLRHPNVMLFMGACTEESNLCIITEFLEGGSVGDLLKKEKLGIKKIVNFAKQTAFGCNYLHLSNILHRDLKPDNLLLDLHHNVKLCDFGLSIIKPTTGVLTKGIGSPVWQSPEMLRGDAYVESTDVYSFAITTWGFFGKEMLDDKNFEEVEDYDGLVKAVAKQGKRPTMPSSCPSELAQLIRSCWDGEPKKRPNFGQIIAHLERISNSL